MTSPDHPQPANAGDNASRELPQVPGTDAPTTTKRVRLADRVAAALRADGTDVVSYGDSILVDACSAFVKTKIHHPLNTMNAALNSLDRAPDLFEKRMMRAHDSRGAPRLVRMFKLKPPPRSAHHE